MVGVWGPLRTTSQFLGIGILRRKRVEVAICHVFMYRHYAHKSIAFPTCGARIRYGTRMNIGYGGVLTAKQNLGLITTS